MSAILGILSKRGTLISRDVFELGMDKLDFWASDFKGIWEDDYITFGSLLLHTNKESKAIKLPYIDTSSGCCITADARLYHKEELALSLGRPSVYVKSAFDHQLILDLYLKFGENCVDYMYGDFVFSIWDPRNEIVFSVRDHFGCKPFFYYNNDDYFIFSSDINSISSFNHGLNVVTEKYIVDCLVGAVPEKSKTAFNSIKRLPPAHAFTVHKDGKLKLKQYWKLEKHKMQKDISENEMISGLKKHFFNSVNERCKGASSVGVELSGGLDSSAIAAVSLLDRDKNKYKVHTFTHSLNKLQKEKNRIFEDQAESIHQLDKFFTIDSHYYITGESSTGLEYILKDYLKTFRSPLNSTIGVFSYFLLEKARSIDVQVLLSGFGGDEGVTSHADGIFLEMARQRKFKRLIIELNKKVKVYGGNFYYNFISIIALSLFPRLISLMRYYGISWRKLKTDYTLIPIKCSLLSKYYSKRRYVQELSPPNDHNISKRQYKRLMGNHISVRLEESHHAALKKRIDYRYPFLDVKLVEYYYSLPSSLKYKNGYGRWAFRKALEDFLPTDICWRKRKEDQMIPYIVLMYQDEIEIFNALIVESKKLNQYHYFDYNKLERMSVQILASINGKKPKFRIRVFFTSVILLILQKWQREGKIDIGIKC